MRPLLMPSSYAPHVGGVEQVVARLAAEFARRGDAPAVVTNHWPRELPSTQVLDGIAVTRHAFRVPQRSPRGVGGWLLRARGTKRAVIADARGHHADVLNLHCVSSNAGYALATADALGIPLVVSLHGELGNDASDAYRTDARLVRLWRALIGNASAITAPSKFVLDEAQAFYGAAFEAPTSVIRNGVDLSRFGRPRSPGARPVVFAVGRLVRPKGFDVLIEAWKLLPPDLDVELVIAGDGPARAALETKAAGLRVTFPGELTPDGVSARMSSADLFVLPSLAEPLGLTVLEAMTARAPVLATGSGGVPELIENGVSGLLVAPGDPYVLAAGILESLGDPAAAQARARRAAEVTAGMSWSACAEAYLEVYRAAVAST